MQCFTRLVRALLGASAIAARKCEYGLSLIVLGIEVRQALRCLSLSVVHRCFGTQVVPKPSGIFFFLSADKVEKYIACIRAALASGYLSAGEASKLAGRLTWTTQHLFFRVGRAMLRPILAQKRSRQVLAWIFFCVVSCACLWGGADGLGDFSGML